MKLTFLGTGTSSGVPMIGCDCPVCRSDDPRNTRLRASLWVETGGLSIIVDTSPDFRLQALHHRIPCVDAVLFTHAHADHVFGFDDIRNFNTIQNAAIPAYANAATLEDLRRIFNYIGLDTVPGVYRPRIDFRVTEGPFLIGDVEVTPLPVLHGPKPTDGYLFRHAGQSLAYVPDCLEMPDETLQAIRGVDIMILDALKHRPHITHLTVADSVALLQRIGARRSFLTHMGHALDHEETQAMLPPGIEPAYDGLVLEWGEEGS